METSAREAGQFQKGLGSKAGGFIAKKFFHPSSYRNQEKLWLANKKKEAEEKMQEQLRLKREDEKRVEDLKKSLYQSTGKAEGAAALRRDEDKSAEELALEKEMKR